MFAGTNGTPSSSVAADFARNVGGPQRAGVGENFVKFALGKTTVVGLRDGYVDMPPTRLRKPDGQPFRGDLPPSIPLVDGKFRLSVNAFLIIDGESHILIDTGAADSWEPTLGRLLRSMQEAGVAPSLVDTVAITHTHEDHVNGLVAADGSNAFPKLKRLFIPSQAIPLFDKIDRLARFRNVRVAIGEGFKIGPSSTAVSALGHELGHMAYEVKGGGSTLLVWGDTVHVPAAQFERPELTWEFDADQDKARASRLRLLRRSNKPGHFIAGAHLDFPGVGYVTRQGDGYRFTPV
ncbi:MBL fold metallo-hydrolase [Paraburkholderia sediminicola]|uniref:MBL fold metallo-hydrolase n=1 Tax=Paraburkholderia sediminicola TaxID=458836 RepID=UPI0038B802DF